MRKSKQIIILRKDLNMRKGKMVSQGSHAVLKVILDMMYNHSGVKYMMSDGKSGHTTFTLTVEAGTALQDWLMGKFTKITCSVDSEQELLELYEKANSLNIPCTLITDAGLTEFGGVPTNTAIVIGPAWEDEVDPITGHLKLL